VHLIKSGEASGSLDAMLERAAVNQERELEARIGMIMGILEPVLILVMGLVVLVIVLAILLPIFELNQLVN
jgi:general secretion pathway protein F